jgi:hypothetical protein
MRAHPAAAHTGGLGTMRLLEEVKFFELEHSPQRLAPPVAVRTLLASAPCMTAATISLLRLRVVSPLLGILQRLAIGKHDLIETAERAARFGGV